MKQIYCRLILLITFLLPLQYSYGQGVTTSSMTGTIMDAGGEGLPGATVVAVHTPTGTRYGTASLVDGRFTIPNMRVGGPYTVTVSFVGFQEQSFNNITLSLGTAATLNVRLAPQTGQLNEVQVISNRNDVFSSDRTGAATNVTREVITSLPTISRSINDFTRLTPQASGQNFGGQDNRLNNITIDGSILNSSFGLAGQPGGRTGTAPISLDAIEEIQVNIAPYDVRQSGFVGAGINAVTRSGTNEFSGSVFYNLQNENLVGDEAKGREVSTTNFNNKQAGFRLGGPILKNKLFFFINGEIERRTEPATSYTALREGQTAGGNTTRVLASELDALSSFLRTNFNYETGPYEGYDSERRSDKILAKLDWNISDKHRASIRYNMLNSQQDILASTSSSVGFGNRRGNTNALNFQNTNYIQNENIRSIIAEFNSTFSSKFSNNLIAGYTYQNEDRGSRGDFFPLVEILSGGQAYTSFGFEPFTPLNQLEYSTLQLQDNFTYYAGKHTLTAGINLERLSFSNYFYPGSQSVYVYNSLDDFYTDANAYLANPDRTGAAPVSLRRFNLRYSALEGGILPSQDTKVTYTGLYLQDNFQALPNFNITAGVRVDVPFFAETGFENPAVNNMTFQSPESNNIKVNTAELPKVNLLFAPRLGFNWDVFNNKSLQLRGGTGVFTGRPAFVWISNQIGNNGILTGYTALDNTTNYPFNPNPATYIPANPTLPPTYELNTTDRNFKFPQVWRSNIAVDKSLVAGIVGTLEFIYGRNINGARYFNINAEQPTTNFAGPDNRLSYPGLGLSGTAQADALRINDPVTQNIYLTNTNEGYSYSATAQLEKPFRNGFFARVAYNFGVAKDIMGLGSTAGSAYTGVRTVQGNNYPELAYSDNDQRHRVIGSVSYRKEYAGFGATQISIFSEARNQARFSYTYGGDMNGDGITFNDLIYIPNNANELTFLPISTGSGADASTLFSAEQQQAAFEAYIKQDSYLNERRGQYAERNGAVLPWVFNTDFSLVQEFFVNVGGKRNTLQLRGDVLNFGNLLNSNWGGGTRFINQNPLVAAGVNEQGIPQYRMATTGTGANQRLLNASTESSAALTDVWRAQIGVRYIFN